MGDKPNHNNQPATARGALTPEAARLFDNDFLRRLEVLRLVSRRSLGGIQPAGRRGLRTGAGLEFAEHRPYTAGDDFRYLDWAAFGRLERLLVRLFQQDEDLQVVLLVDLSASMLTGQPTKADYARKLAAALAYVALGNLDRLHLITFSAGATDRIDSSRGRGQIFAILNFLADAHAGGGTDLLAATVDLQRHSLQPGLAIVLSDLLDPKGPEAGLRRLQQQGHEVWALRIESPEEAAPPWQGEVELADAESDGAARMRLTPQRVSQYMQRRQGWIDALSHWSVEHEVSLLAAPTSLPPDDLVLNVLRRRGLLR